MRVQLVVSMFSRVLIYLEEEQKQCHHKYFTTIIDISYS